MLDGALEPLKRPRHGASKQLMADYYNYGAMVSYAHKWWHGRNSAYVVYGDDCTNFVSQCMKAGGWATVGSWPGSSRSDDHNWYVAGYSWDTSYSWGGAQNWYDFAHTISHRTILLSSSYDLSLGDVLQYDHGKNGNIDHTQICTGITSSGIPTMTQHTDDYADQPLNEIFARDGNGTSGSYHYAHRT